MELKEFAEEVLRGVEEKAGGKLKMRLVPREKTTASHLQELRHSDQRAVMGHVFI